MSQPDMKLSSTVDWGLSLDCSHFPEAFLRFAIASVTFSHDFSIPFLFIIDLLHLCTFYDFS